MAEISYYLYKLSELYLYHYTCTISNIVIILVTYRGYNEVVHPIGVEPMTLSTAN